MKKLLMSSLAAGTLVIAGAMPAFAGEVTGNGDPTPVQSYQAGSICSFSGLNDVPDGSDHPEDPFAPGRVQSFGDIVQEVAGASDRGASGMTEMIKTHGPGTSCRGYASQS